MKWDFRQGLEDEGREEQRLYNTFGHRYLFNTRMYLHMQKIGSAVLEITVHNQHWRRKMTYDGFLNNEIHDYKSQTVPPKTLLEKIFPAVQ